MSKYRGPFDLEDVTVHSPNRLRNSDLTPFVPLPPDVKIALDAKLDRFAAVRALGDFAASSADAQAVVDGTSLYFNSDGTQKSL